MLAELVSALSPRLPPKLIADFSRRTSQEQVANTLKNSIVNAVRGTINEQ